MRSAWYGDVRKLRADRTGLPSIYMIFGHWAFLGTLAPTISEDEKKARNDSARAWVAARNASEGRRP